MSEKPTSPHGSSLRRSAPIKRGGELQRKTGLERHASLERAGGPKRNAPLARQTVPKRQAISPASPAQREKIKGKACVICGKPATTPMHLWPRGQGGCDDSLCVLPACWGCHRAYDEQRIELLGHIVKHFRAEIAHAHLHANPIDVLERLTASTVVLDSRLPRPRPALAAAEPAEPSAAATA